MHLAESFANSILSHVKLHGSKTPFYAIEVGAWTGCSTSVMSSIIQKFIDVGKLNNNSRLIVIDAFMPCYDDEAKDNLHYKKMNENLKLGLVHKYFIQNVTEFGSSQVISTFIGYSKDILPRLYSESFHYIYLDGSHKYRDVLADMKFSVQLLVEGGVLAGDDLETLNISNLNLHNLALEKNLDYGSGYHPGVTQAFLDIFGYQSKSIIDGFYAIKKQKQNFTQAITNKINSLNVGLPYWVPMDCKDVLLLRQDQVKKRNFVLTCEGILSIPHKVGPVLFDRRKISRLLKDKDAKKIRNREEIWEAYIESKIQ
jgi:hypothetical protein